MSKLMQLCCTVILFSLPLAAFQTPANKGKNKPPAGVSLNENDTPLDKLIEKTKTAIEDKVAAEKAKGNQDCIQADALPEDDDKPGKKAKACKVMQFKGNKFKGPAADVTDVHGNKVGKKVKTRTKLVFDGPQQRGIGRWDELNELKYAGRPSLDFVGVASGKQASSMRVRTLELPTSERINNDKDCIDSATGQRHGGYVYDENGARSPNPDSCFDQSGQLKITLTRTAGPDSDCVHANGKIYSSEECTDLKLTTLQELIDEDSPTIEGGPAVDGDMDANVDDVPDVGPNSVCSKFHGDIIPGGAAESCDLNAAARRELNLQAMAQLPEGKKKKLFKINEAGQCDPTADGEFECGQEPREIELEETLELSCPAGSIYEDSRCIILPQAEPERAAALTFLAAPASTRTASDYAMMGFTFAPPVLKWGIFEVDRVCIFGACFEIFALKFGYEFELAAGLRLPVKLTVADIPTPQINAQDTSTMTTTLEPVDFKVSDYVSFCQKHNLDRSWWISDCNRFAFPEYFESMLPDSMFSSPGDRQGSEFVLQNTTFAGLVIRVFSIPVVNFAVDSSVNVPAMCTLYKMKQQIADGGAADWIRLLADFGTDFQKSKDFMSSLENTLTNCASFTTPYGLDEKNEPRQFPFLTGSFSIPADCTREQIEGSVVKVGGESKPMCTGLKATIYGATLGLGIELVPSASSDLIKAQATASGDAQLDQTLRFHWGDPSPSLGPVTYNNFDTTRDTASVNVDDFVYYLNTFRVQVNGIVELGGLLAFIGNVASIPLADLTFDLGEYGIPIPQHPGTGPISIEVPVVNYALTVDAKPRPDDPMRVSDDVLKVKPGTPGIYEVWVKNEGTVPDTIDNFRYALSNKPQTSAAYEFGIYPNTDFDCVDSSSKLYWGYPFDSLPDDCYNADGTVRADRTEVTADDSTTVWSANYGTSSVSNVPAHSISGTPVLLSVSPYRHPLTKPGDYPVRIMADSRGARDLNLEALDPSLVPRLNAEKVVIMRIESFFEPQVTLTPSEAAVKPRGSVTYTVEAANYGNDLDQFAMEAAFAESDTVGCTLTTNGSLPQCPFRAQITRADSANWTTVAQLHPFFPASGLFDPLASAKEMFTITAPLDWAGMQDTTYEFTLTATSTRDTAITKAKNEKSARFKIIATKESMARYVNLEVTEFLEQLNLASAQGVKMRGIQPVVLHPITMMTSKALDQILAGDLGGASKTLSSAIRVMEAVDRMVIGAGLPEPLAGDWKARSAAILGDMRLAQAYMVSSQ